MTTYQVYLESSASGCMAHILSLPGCTAFGRNEKAALKNLKAAVKIHLQWLKNHHQAVTLPRNFSFKITERKEGTSPWLSGSAAALFLPDLIPPPPSDIREYIKLLRFSRDDLLNLVNRIPQNLLDFRLKQRRTIRQVLNHIANAEWWYLSRIYDWKELDRIPWKVAKKEVLKRMGQVRSLAYRILPRLADSRYHQIVVPRKYCNMRLNEPWTARKVLRRFIEHEREHFLNIQEILAQIEKLPKLWLAVSV